jgi:hypothetical protein
MVSFRIFARRWVRSCLVLAVGLMTLVVSTRTSAQTIEDGVMMPKKTLCTGFIYGHDRWDEYWEGTLKRTNGNIGTITTQNVTWVADFGVTSRLNFIAMLPYVWTNASQGVLHGMSGLQDVTVAAKYSLFETSPERSASFRTILVASADTPVSSYSPDFLPLSIGTSSSQSAARVTMNLQGRKGWFVTGTAAYTWRGNVTLDRPFYFTNNEAFLSNEVAMPNVLDYALSGGYMKSGLQIPITFSREATRGGGDIRRQDAPFVSNRVIYSKVDGLILYALPHPKNLSIKLEASHILSGRNVGQSTTLMSGLLYTFHF